VRVKDLECDFLRNMMAFGDKNAFFCEDKTLLIDFCRGILTVYNKFR